MGIDAKKARILIIEPDRETSSIAKFCIEKLLFAQVKTANTLSEGVSEAKTLLPHLILLGEEGSKNLFAEWIEARRTPEIQSVPVVLLSKNHPKKDDLKTTETGIIDTIHKPLDPLLFPMVIKGILLTL